MSDLRSIRSSSPVLLDPCPADDVVARFSLLKHQPSPHLYWWTASALQTPSPPILFYADRPQQSGLTLINTRDDLVILAHRGFVHTAICTRYPSAMPSHRPSAPPPTVVEFGLPLLTLTNLAVVDLNQPAADALRLAWVEGQTAALETAALLGFKEAEAEDGRRAEEWARGELDRLAEQSRGLRWDEGIAVELHAARGAEPIEVDVRVVRVAPSEGAADLVYSILLLRPSSSSLSPTPRVKSPTSPSPASSPQNPSTATPSPPSPSPDYIPDEPALQPADHLHRIVNSFSNIVSAQSNPPALGATTSPPVGGRFLPPTQDLVDFVSIAPAILVMLSAEGQLLWLNDSYVAIIYFDYCSFPFLLNGY